MKKVKTKVQLKQKINIYTKFVVALTVFCLVAVVVSPIVYYGLTIYSKTSTYPGYGIVDKAISESNNGNTPKHSCNTYSNINKTVRLKLSDYWKPCITINLLFGSKEICLKDFYNPRLDVRTHCSSWCSEFADYAYNKTGYDLKLSSKYEDSRGILGEWLEDHAEDVCSINWKKFNIDCDWDLEFWPMKPGNERYGISGDDIRNTFSNNFAWFDNNSYNRKYHPPLPGDVITNSHHTMIVKDVSFDSNGYLIIEEISGNVGPTSNSCDDDNRDGCKVDDSLYTNFDNEILGWGRIFKRSSGDVYEPEPSIPFVQNPKLAFGTNGIKLLSFKTRIQNNSYRIDRSFQNVYYPNVKMTSRYVTDQKMSQPSHGRTKYYSLSGTTEITNKNQYTNPTIATFSVLRPDDSVARSHSIKASNINFSNLNNPSFDEYNGQPAQDVYCPNNNGILEEYDKESTYLDSISGSITFNNVWLEDYRIGVDVNFVNGCCTGQRFIDFGEFLSSKHTVKKIGSQTKSFTINIDQLISYVPGSGDALELDIFLVDKNGHSHYLYFQQYKLEEERSDDKILCGKIGPDLERIDYQGMLDIVTKGLASYHVQLDPWIGNVNLNDVLVVDPRELIVVTVPRNRWGGVDTIIKDPIISSVTPDELFLTKNTDMSNVGYYMIEDYNAQTGNYEINNDFLFYNNTEKFDADNIDIGTVAIFGAKKSLYPSDKNIVRVSESAFTTDMLDQSFQGLTAVFNMKEGLDVLKSQTKIKSGNMFINALKLK